MRIKKPVILILFYVLSFVSVYSGEYIFNIYFELNKFSLTNDDQLKIKSVIDSLSKYNISQIRIIGHTDNSADSLYNIHLSNKRADAVEKYILSFGFNEKIFEKGYFGENKPITNNETKEAKKRNRRAEIFIVHSQGATEIKTAGCVEKDTVIRTKSGKEIVMSKCDFEEIKNCFEVNENKNYYELKKGIVIMNKGGQDLKTYGMLEVNLLDGCSKEPCFKKPITIRFPLKTAPSADNIAWALIKGEKNALEVVTINNRIYYELKLKCPTSWINCNCKKNQKH